MHIARWRSRIRKWFSVGNRPGASSWAQVIGAWRMTATRRKSGRSFAIPPVEVLECRQLLAALQPELLRDINPLHTTGDSKPQQVLAVGSSVYFVATGSDGVEALWKSDGTASGTVRLYDFRSRGTSQLASLGSSVYFPVLTNAGRLDLWKTNGTQGGTAFLKTLSYAYASVSTPPAFSFASVKNTLYFSFGRDLWQTDGTSAGTRIVDIPDLNFPKHLTNVNGTLYFTGHLTFLVDELWKSDGTVAGSSKIPILDSNGLELDGVTNLTNMNGTLYFGAGDSSHAGKLWKTNGTGSGSVVVRDLSAGRSDASLSDFTNVNGRLYFAVTDDREKLELWTSNGASAGTRLMKVLNPGGARDSVHAELENVNGVLYFASGTGTAASALWKSNGSASGTVMVRDGLFPTELVNANGTLYFSAVDANLGRELWKSRGTVATTTLAVDVNTRATPAGGSNPTGFVNVSGIAYFIAQNPSLGEELWKSNGTSAGTVLVKDINPGSGSSSPRGLTNVGGTLFFSARDARHGGTSTNFNELWKSDGTASGTVLLRDFLPGASGPGEITELTEMGGRLYFTASDGVHGRELWTSDGTRPGTRMIKDLAPGSGASAPSELNNINGVLYFAAKTGLQGQRLWRSDGTSEGTFALQGEEELQFGDRVYGLTEVNGTLYFAMADLSRRSDGFPNFGIGTHGTNLWKSDGTAGGTVLVKTIRSEFYPAYYQSGEAPVGPVGLANLNGRLYFSGGGLWTSDGTSAGTRLIALGRLSDLIVGLRSVNEKLYFNAVQINASYIGATSIWTTGSSTSWTSDGTDPGTRLAGSDRPLANVNGTLYFTRDDGLWRSDGAAGHAQPVLVGDFSALSSWEFQAIVNGHVFIAAYDGVRGYEPWILRLNGAPNSSAPRPTVNPLIVTDLSAHTFSFKVKYTTSNHRPVDEATLRTGNVTVTGPNGYQQVATFVSVDSNAGGSSRVATYSVAAPSSAWREVDEGIYRFAVGTQPVKDSLGNVVRQGNLGAFAVSFPVYPDERSNVTIQLINGEMLVVSRDSSRITKLDENPGSIPLVMEQFPDPDYSFFGLNRLDVQNNVFENPWASTVVINSHSRPAGTSDRKSLLIVDTTGALLTQQPADLSAKSGQYMLDNMHTVRYSGVDIVVPIMRMYRTYNPNADQHVFTTSTAEFRTITGYGLHDETTDQAGWAVAASPVPNTIPLLRLYNHNNGEHYYTTSSGERDILVSLGWNFEKVEGYMSTDGNIGSPIYRLYNQVSGGHIFTENQQTRDSILAQFPGIWVQHGILGYGFQVGADEVRSSAAAASSVAQSQITAAEMAANVLTLPSASRSQEVPNPGSQPAVVASPVVEVSGLADSSKQGTPVAFVKTAESTSSTSGEEDANLALDEFWSALPDTLTPGALDAPVPVRNTSQTFR